MALKKLLWLLVNKGVDGIWVFVTTPVKISPTIEYDRPFAKRDRDGRIVAVQLAWQKFVPPRSPFHILIGSGESTWHHTAHPSALASWYSTIGNGSGCYRKVKAVEGAKKFCNCNCKGGFLRLKPSLSGAVAHHLVVGALLPSHCQNLFRVNCSKDAVYWGRALVEVVVPVMAVVVIGIAMPQVVAKRGMKTGPDHIIVHHLACLYLVFSPHVIVWNCHW